MSDKKFINKITKIQSKIDEFGDNKLDNNEWNYEMYVKNSFQNILIVKI